MKYIPQIIYWSFMTALVVMYVAVFWSISKHDKMLDHRCDPLPRIGETSELRYHHPVRAICLLPDGGVEAR
jgi:hypothetical protein